MFVCLFVSVHWPGWKSSRRKVLPYGIHAGRDSDGPGVSVGENEAAVRPQGSSDRMALP